MARKFTFRRKNAKTYSVCRHNHNIGIDTGIITWDEENRRFEFFSYYYRSDCVTLPTSEFESMKAAFEEFHQKIEAEAKQKADEAKAEFIREFGDCLLSNI